MIKTINYDTRKILLYNEETNTGEVLDLDQLEQEVLSLENLIGEIELFMKDDKKLLEWARQVYPVQNRIDELKQQLLDKQELLK